MGLFDKIFGRKQDKMIPITQVVKERIPENATVVAQSDIPAYVQIGNLVFNKNYEEAIVLGKALLQENPDSPGIHINLMDAYFKGRSQDNGYFELSTFHAKQAMLHGHNTGYAQKRLIINLEKSKLYYQALQLCDIILSDRFNFSSHGGGTKEEFSKRREAILTKISKGQSLDTSSDSLFSESLIDLIFKNIGQNNISEQQRQAKIKENEVDYENWFSEEENNRELEELKNILNGKSEG